MRQFALKSAVDWSHAGKPWSFWEQEGRFFYVFGDMYEDGSGLCFEDSETLKIGITGDPKNRLKDLRREYSTHGTWMTICWMESSAPIIERALKELFNPWKVPFQDEVFSLPREVSDWLYEGVQDSWRHVAKHDRLQHTLSSIIDCILPRYYPAGWIEKRLSEMRPII